MINILTDSTADIPKDLREAYHIEVIPMYIQLNGSVYRDGEIIHPEFLFESAPNTGQYPATSAPSPGDFIKFFDRDSDSIYIGVSSKLSTTFRNAQLVAKEINHKKVDLIESRSISMGYGQVVIQAAQWRKIYLTHLDCDEEAEFIKEHIEATDLPIQIREAEVGCVLATHSGPNPLGIAYYIQ